MEEAERFCLHGKCKTNRVERLARAMFESNIGDDFLHDSSGEPPAP
jgi:hypothetical protein